jgi:hypothetical protein
MDEVLRCPKGVLELCVLLRQIFQEPEAQTLLTVFERLVARRADMVTRQDFQGHKLGSPFRARRSLYAFATGRGRECECGCKS